MDGSSSLHVQRERVGVFTCHSQSLAEVLADRILQVPDSRSRKLAEGPRVRWGPLSASTGVCLQKTHVTGQCYFNQSHNSAETLMIWS